MVPLGFCFLNCSVAENLFGDESKLTSILLGNVFLAQSDEDLALKQQLELYVERVQDPDPGLQKVALESMR